MRLGSSHTFECTVSSFLTTSGIISLWMDHRDLTDLLLLDIEAAPGLLLLHNTVINILVQMSFCPRAVVSVTELLGKHDV